MRAAGAAYHAASIYRQNTLFNHSYYRLEVNMKHDFSCVLYSEPSLGAIYLSNLRSAQSSSFLQRSTLETQNTTSKQSYRRPRESLYHRLCLSLTPTSRCLPGTTRPMIFPSILKKPLSLSKEGGDMETFWCTAWQESAEAPRWWPPTSFKSTQ